MIERTTRQKIEQIIENSMGGISPSRIATYFDEEVQEKDVLNHIQHIKKSRDLLVKPPECRSCGFSEFDKKANIPSSCPECYSERFFEPKFKIES